MTAYGGCEYRAARERGDGRRAAEGEGRERATLTMCQGHRKPQEAGRGRPGN